MSRLVWFAITLGIGIDVLSGELSSRATQLKWPGESEALCFDGHRPLEYGKLGIAKGHFFAASSASTL